MIFVIFPADSGKKLGDVCGFYEDTCNEGLYCVKGICTDKKPACTIAIGRGNTCPEGYICDKYYKTCIAKGNANKKCNSSSDCSAHQYCGFSHNDYTAKKCIENESRCTYSAHCGIDCYCDLLTNTCKKISGDYAFCLYSNDCLEFETCEYFGSTPVGLCYPYKGYCTKKFENETCKGFEKCNETSRRCELKPGKCYSLINCGQGEYCNMDTNSCESLSLLEEQQGQSKEKTKKQSNYDEFADKTGEKLIIFIFDNSGSMSDDNKLALAKNASANALGRMEHIEIALLSFKDCSVKTSLNWTKDMKMIKDAINGFAAKGSTPLAKSLEQAYSLLNERAEQGKKAYIILFTDGEETCHGDPCKVVKEYNGTSKIPVYTIGYVVGSGAKNQLQCIANYSGGQYLEAPTPEQIDEILGETIEMIENKTVSCTGDANCSENEVCADGNCTQTKLHLVFVPINWKSGDDEFGAEVKVQTDFFLYSIPSLDGCKEKVKISKAGDCNFTINKSGSISDLNEIYECALKKYGKFDFAIGIGEKGIFDDGMAGYTAKKEPMFIERGNEMVMAHEMGHKFGLVDEYCYCPNSTVACGGEPNPLKAEYGCDPDGNCCWKNGAGQICMVFGSGRPCRTGYEDAGCYTCCDGNKNELGGISIMSWANAAGPRYHDVPSLDYLANDSKLRCD